ncbi:hypothetical protein ACSQ67_025925 [Phaseolus vulgaris]
MKYRVSHKLLVLPHRTHPFNSARYITSFARKFITRPPRASINGGSGNSQGDSFIVPGATVATILMLGVLHARRLYDDKKTEGMKEKGIEVEFQPDIKATFLRLLPLRSISRCWGYMTSMEIPVWLRPVIYKAWARAFHSNLEEAGLPLDKYATLKDFFVRTLKEGSRPIDVDPQCLVSPVDGTVLRFGELKGAGAMIEQVKGFSYSVFLFLVQALSFQQLLMVMCKRSLMNQQQILKRTKSHGGEFHWLHQKFGTQNHHGNVMNPKRGLFYCVVYLKPGDYHRIHSPADWNILVRRHFSGRLYPLNERATRTIRNLYIENERVILEGLWQEGFMALAAIGATNIGSIELFIEPELHTNRPMKKFLHSEPPEERVYECEGVGRVLTRGDELGAFNMGSTVVLVFQAPISKLNEGDSSQEFRFCVQSGDRIRVGEALGRWHSS